VPQNTQIAWWIIFAGLALAVAFWPRSGLLAKMRRLRSARERAGFEDALKHILAWEHRGKVATPESMTGALGLGRDRIPRLITRLEESGLVRSAGGGVRLTARGEQWALHVVRAHRLWERYLADDAGTPMSRLHQLAEKAEHQLTAENLDELDAHLGYPEHDPHGDPIPSADGSLTPLTAVPLTDWPVGEPARIVHLEDEPNVIFQQIVAAGLRPGHTLRILDASSTRLVVSDGETEHRFAPVVAANIQVAAPPKAPERPAGTVRLWNLRDGESADVVELDAECRGFSRRRLMDLGLTPGGRVEAALTNTFGDPRAYRVRGALIALRQQQAELIWVRRTAAARQAAIEKRGEEVTA
jgi:DtxR family Mn-dependent transcriptional regulator